MNIRIGHIVAISLTVMAFASLLPSCNSIDDDTIAGQRSKMVTYLQKTYGSDDSQQQVYENVGGVYRYITNIDRPGRDETTAIRKGDQVEFWFSEYLFTSEPGKTPIYSNEPEEIAKLPNTTGYTNLWPREAMTIKLGSTSLIKGLNSGFKGCCEKDTVWLFITADLAYGKKPIFTLPENAATAFRIYISKVTK